MFDDELNDDHDHEVEEGAEGHAGTAAEDSLQVVHDNHTDDSQEQTHSDHSTAPHSLQAPAAHQSWCKTPPLLMMAPVVVLEVSQLGTHSTLESVQAQVDALQQDFTKV